MKTKLLFIGMVLWGVSMLGQEKTETPEKTPEEKAEAQINSFKTDFQADLDKYDVNIAKLNDPENIKDLKFNSDALKAATIVLKNKLVDICNKIESFKEVYKTQGITQKNLDKWFDPKLCKNFNDKIVADTKPNNSYSDKLTYLNAYNFDFNNSSSNNGYLGHLNIFFSLDKEDKWKLNAGLMNIKYSSNANENNYSYQTDNVLIHPLDNVVSGTKYLKEFNKYTKNTKISSWSAYLQLMKRIIPIHENSAIYAHAHGELLISQVEYHTEITNIQRDTVIATSAPNVYQALIDRNYTAHQTYIGAYFGIGITGDFKVFESTDKAYSLEYFVQSTIGGTNNQLNTTEKGTVNDLNQYVYNINPDSHIFHLTNTYINNKFNGVNIMVGTQIRGLINLPPLYMFYVGLNTDLNKVAEIFKK